MSIQKILISNLIFTLAIIVLLSLIGDYYLLQKELHFYALLVVALLFPISSGFAFIIIRKALSCLNKVAQEVANRDPNYLEPVELSNVPQEAQPLIEEINLLFARLHEGFQREKRFAADAAHELRTPLAALKTQAQVALKAEDPDVQKLALENVIEGVNRSTHLIQQLLTLSRLLMQGDTPFEVSEVSLHHLAVEVLMDMAPRAISRKVEIELVPEKEKNSFQGNAKALKALLFNLVDNAIRYMPEKGGEIIVMIERKADTIVLKITDSGPGIPEEYRNRVFEWFFRISGNNTPGSGLGFAIIEQVVKLHHAEINILTPSSGKGLEVYIAFPLRKNLTCH